MSVIPRVKQQCSKVKHGVNCILTSCIDIMTSYLTHHTDHQRFTGSIGVFITFAEEAGLFLHVPPGVQHAAGTETYHRSLPFDV